MNDHTTSGTYRAEEYEFDEDNFVAHIDIDYVVDVEMVSGDDYYGPEITDLKIDEVRLGGLKLNRKQFCEMVGLSAVRGLEIKDLREHANEKLGG